MTKPSKENPAQALPFNALTTGTTLSWRSIFARLTNYDLAIMGTALLGLGISTALMIVGWGDLSIIELKVPGGLVWAEVIGNIYLFLMVNSQLISGASYI